MAYRWWRASFLASLRTGRAFQMRNGQVEKSYGISGKGKRQRRSFLQRWLSRAADRKQVRVDADKLCAAAPTTFFYSAEISRDAHSSNRFSRSVGAFPIAA